MHSKSSLRSDLVGASALVDVNDVRGARTSLVSGDHTLYCVLAARN